MLTLPLLLILALSIGALTPASPDGVVSRLSGETDAPLSQSVLPSPAYPHTTTLNAAIPRLYQHWLCRAPDQEGLAYWLETGLAPKALAQELAVSEEGIRAAVTRRAYLETLGRDPIVGDCGGLHSWAKSGIPYEDMLPLLASSPEGQRVAKVRQVFREVLGRDPLGTDNASLRRWVESGLAVEEIRVALRAQRPLVGVYLFTWYAPAHLGWSNGATLVDPNAPEPLLGWYNSSDPAVLEQQIAEIEETGFDYIALHVVSWSPESWRNAGQVFRLLEGRDLHAAIVLDSLYDASPGEKAWWSGYAAEAFGAHPNYFRQDGEPLVMLYAAPIDFSLPGAAMRNVYWTRNYRQSVNTFNTHGLLRPTDWSFWEESPQQVVNGVVPVLPGYRDDHLERPFFMTHDRNGGQLYHEQWQRALELRPETVLVYSWNEHFEESAIEPTAAWGDLYLQWTSCYIRHARAGTMGDCALEVELPADTAAP